MDDKLLLIPAVLVVVGIVVMVMLNKKGGKSAGVAQDAMKRFVNEEVPQLSGAGFEVIGLMDDAPNAQHVWVVSFDTEGLYVIPATVNPMTRSISRYKDTTPWFHVKKQIASRILAGDKSEDISYLPLSEITAATVDAARGKLSLQVDDQVRKFKFQKRDFFGASQEQAMECFLKAMTK